MMNKTRVVFYARVSTEHEAQVNALENQMQWYEEELRKHPEWEKVAEYVDKGITGTLAKKRPQFMQMIEDADKGIFDMIVTREISRFARNYVEAGEYARKLIEKGVAIYFVHEGINTSDPSSNMMFGIFSIVAEEESRKISDRVKAGQNISRKNGILYGNGNILGYQLKRNINENGKWKSNENTYEIIEDEAETVRMIFDMYLNGMGQQKIQKELTRLGRRNADGEVSWCASKISRILHRKTYAGYLEYNQSRVFDPITKKRKKETDRSTYTSVKGDWEPIISEETWNEAQRILATKTQVIQNRQGMSRVAGKPLTDDLWKKKLVCKCGRSFRRNKWRVNKKTAETVFGYQCYNQLNNGAAKTRIKAGLSAEGYCDVPMIADWKLELMAKTVLDELWNERKESVDLAIDLIKKYYIDDNDGALDSKVKKIEVEIQRNKSRIDALLVKWLDGDIDEEIYKRSEGKFRTEMSTLQAELESLKQKKENVVSLDKKLDTIKEEMMRQIDFSGSTISHDVLERVIHKIIPQGEGKFKWILNLMGDLEYDIKIEGRKNKAKIFFEEKNVPLSQVSSGCYCQ